MQKYLLILFVTFFIFGCSHKNTRRSDFSTGCFIGASSVIQSMGANSNDQLLLDYCINMYDSNPHLDKKLDEVNKYLPPKTKTIQEIDPAGRYNQIDETDNDVFKI